MTVDVETMMVINFVGSLGTVFGLKNFHVLFGPEIF